MYPPFPFSCTGVHVFFFSIKLKRPKTAKIQAFLKPILKTIKASQKVPNVKVKNLSLYLSVSYPFQKLSFNTTHIIII